MSLSAVKYLIVASVQGARIPNSKTWSHEIIAYLRIRLQEIEVKKDFEELLMKQANSGGCFRNSPLKTKKSPTTSH